MHLKIIVIIIAYNGLKMNATDIIKKAGLKITPQRKIVYEAIAELKHAAIDTIIAKVQESNPDITISTIYRILDSFYKADILSQVNHPNDGKTYYDITPIPHHHIFEGQKIIDYSDPKLTELIRRYLKEGAFETENIDKIQVQIIINPIKSD